MRTSTYLDCGRHLIFLAARNGVQVLSKGILASASIYLLYLVVSPSTLRCVVYPFLARRCQGHACGLHLSSEFLLLCLVRTSGASPRSKCIVTSIRAVD